MQIFGGDNIVASRQAFIAARKALTDSGIKEVIEFDGKKLNLADLHQALESTSLFGTDRVVCIENLLARPRSKLKQQLINYLQEQNQNERILLWEAKKISPAQKKWFAASKLQEYSLSSKIFTFLDSFKPDNSHQLIPLLDQVVEHDSPEMVFAMILRQIRLLIQVKNHVKISLAPWQQKKLSEQAKTFDISALLKIHNQLLTIDTEIKTGKNIGGVRHQLDRLIISI